MWSTTNLGPSARHNIVSFRSQLLVIAASAVEPAMPEEAAPVSLGHGTADHVIVTEVVIIGTAGGGGILGRGEQSRRRLSEEDLGGQRQRWRDLFAAVIVQIEQALGRGGLLHPGHGHGQAAIAVGTSPPPEPREGFLPLDHHRGLLLRVVVVVVVVVAHAEGHREISRQGVVQAIGLKYGVERRAVQVGRDVPRAELAQEGDGSLVFLLIVNDARLGKRRGAASRHGDAISLLAHRRNRHDFDFQMKTGSGSDDYCRRIKRGS